MGLKALVKQWAREVYEEIRQESVGNIYKQVRVNGSLQPKAGHVWVVPIDNPDASPRQVPNGRTDIAANLPVNVGVDNTTNVEQVLGVADSEMYDRDEFTGQSFNVPSHGDKHGGTSQGVPPFNNSAIDMIRSLSQRSIYPGRVRPAAAGGVAIDIGAFTYWHEGTRKLFPETVSYSLSSHVPATANRHLFAFIYITKSTGAVTVTTGSESLYVRTVAPSDPTYPGGDIVPLASVRLYNGMTAISEQWDILDERSIAHTPNTFGSLELRRTTTWLGRIKNVNTTTFPRLALLGGNSVSDTNYYVMSAGEYSDSTTAITAGFQANTSYDADTDTVRSNSYGFTIRVNESDGLVQIISHMQSADNGGNIEFIRADGTVILHLDESTQNVGLGSGTPDSKLDVGAGAIEFDEMSDPGVGAANTARLYAKDNGAGKTQLVVQFPSGAVQVLATEP